ncbi:hypothetical protein PTKIN_Ptkin13bG0126600 [Pterospermum kingtungense]
MATFTSAEIIGLRGGGNERAKEVYFKEWDLQRQFVADNCNIEGLRKFIKHVYVDGRYTGENEKSTVDGPNLTPKMVEMEDSFTHRNGLHSMAYLDNYEGNCIERSGSSERSDPRNGKESQNHGDCRRTITAFFEEVDDKFRDAISDTTMSEANWNISNKTHNLQRRPSNQYQMLDSSRPREVRSLRDVLHRIQTLRLSEAPKEEGGWSSDGSVHMQRNMSTIEKRHIDGSTSMEPEWLNSIRCERKDLESPVNVSSDYEPASQAQQSPKSIRQPIRKPTSSPNSTNSVRVDCFTQENRLNAYSNAKNMDSFVPDAKPVGNLSIKSHTSGMLLAKLLNMPRTPSDRGVSPASPLTNVLTSSPTSNSPRPKAALVTAALSSTTSYANHLKEKQGTPQPQCSIFPDTCSQSTSHEPSSIRNLPSSQFVSQHIPQGHGSGPAVISYSGPSEQKTSGRKECPQHPFATTYTSAPVQSPGWQPVQVHGMGNGSQYSPAMQFPTMYQPNVLEARSLLRSSSFGSPCAEWMPPQSSSRMPSSSQRGQQVPNNLPPPG